MHGNEKPRRFVRMAALALAALVATSAPMTGPAAAQDETVTLQGDAAERAATREDLFRALRAARDPAAARLVTNRIWLFWFQAPDEEAARLMREALLNRRASELPATLLILDELVAEAPDWAEAWNQRATIRFMVGDYEGSLADIDRVLPLEPKHFGALSGEAMILMRLGRQEEAQAVLKRAVKIHPFLAERALLKPEPEGRDI